jgi:hypothetical protein
MIRVTVYRRCTDVGTDYRISMFRVTVYGCCTAVGTDYRINMFRVAVYRSDDVQMLVLITE